MSDHHLFLMQHPLSSSHEGEKRK